MNKPSIKLDPIKYDITLTKVAMMYQQKTSLCERLDILRNNTTATDRNSRTVASKLVNERFNIRKI